MNKTLEITDITIFIKKSHNESEKAFVKLELNGSLVINGIRILKGKLGHFVSYPGSENTPYKFIDLLSITLRKKLQNAILQAYARELACVIN